ncbi:glutathione S-transferase family protein [Pseudomonas sp. BGr12]|uniref:glutathione S-transferase family protein n=1 Tax=Pseudomonas sp. BGr12 TaxID=2936269 RepID=UPI002559B369|nr:glutathione S-transferase family protein [Pseudomonas sp. BJa5]MDL2428419.1 glutathione S-transferase family protein [Pseudomonas sp. BJa5]
MYTLYYVPDWASLSVRFVLEELGAPYEGKLVDNSRAERDSPEFRAISPLGLIPALQTPDGALFETTAILLWLADQHQSMAPEPGSPDRANFLKWLVFTNNTVHNLILNLFHPERVSSVDSNEVTLQLARGQIQNALSLIDRMLQQDQPAWLSADDPSILCYYLALLMRWMNGFEVGHPANIKSEDYPALHAMLVELETRPASRKCAEIEGLGETIFTNPTLL